MHLSFIRDIAALYAEKVLEKSGALDKNISFVDRTVLVIARAKVYLPQINVCNGEKRKNALTFQAVNAKDGSILDVSGPIEVRLH